MSENVEKVEIEDELTKEEDFSESELADEFTDWKAKAMELKGLNKRRATKLAKAKEALNKPPVPLQTPPKEEKKGDVDYPKLAYLAAKGVPDEDVPYIQEVAAATGKEVRDVLATVWVQRELAERKELRDSKNAVPAEGGKRTGGNAADEVDYYLTEAKMGELPKDNPELARKVVNARIALDKNRGNKTPFTDNPVA